MEKVRVRTKVWLESDGWFVIGDGGLELLLGIAERGSLAAAARRVGWSYRHAWGYLHRAEHALGAALTAPRPGKGAARGMILTPGGRRLVARLLAIRRRIDAAVGSGRS
jgi:molybdate transport system regulatory protein